MRMARSASVRVTPLFARACRNASPKPDILLPYLVPHPDARPVCTADRAEDTIALNVPTRRRRSAHPSVRITWPVASIRSAGASPPLVDGGDRLNPAHLFQELVEQRRLPPRAEFGLLEPAFIGGGPPAPQG